MACQQDGLCALCGLLRTDCGYDCCLVPRRSTSRYRFDRLRFVGSWRYGVQRGHFLPMGRDVALLDDRQAIQPSRTTIVVSPFDCGSVVRGDPLLRIRLSSCFEEDEQGVFGGLGKMKTFGYFLLSGWLLLFLFAVLAFSFPKTVSHFLHSFANYVQLVPIALMVGTVAYGLIRIYRLGMKRPSGDM